MSRRGMTLVEMLVAMTATLLLMASTLGCGTRPGDCAVISPGLR